MVKAMKLKIGNPLRKLVLIKLADNASDVGECWPSYQHVADQCEISRRSVMSHVAALIDGGYLAKEIRKGGPKGNTSNLYLLTLDGKPTIASAGDSPGSKKRVRAGANAAPPGAGDSLGSAGDSLGGGEGDSPRISHSFESVNEPVSEPLPLEAEASAGSVGQVVVASKPRIEIPADMPGPKDQSCKTFKTWANYAFAYRKRYLVWPLWNATVGGQIGRFIAQVGADAAPKVAAFYLSVNDVYVVKDGHSFGVLLKGSSKYHTEWQTGRTMTATAAQQIDKTQSNYNAAGDAQAILRQRRAERETANANS